MGKSLEGFESRFPFRARARYENGTCGDCATAERSAAKKGQRTLTAACARHMALRTVVEPSIGDWAASLARSARLTARGAR